MILDPSSDLTDVINRAHFGVDRSTGFGEGRGLVKVGPFIGLLENRMGFIAQHYLVCM